MQSLSSANAKLIGVADRDHAGTSVASGDVDGDSFSDVFVGAPDEDAGGNAAGAVYLVLGSGLSGTVDLSAADSKIVGEATRDGAGTSLAGAGDVDGDGLDDLLVGAPGADSGGGDSGAAYLVLGTPAAALDLGAADAEIAGENASDAAGTSVGGGEDADGDGYADLLVGAPGNTAGGTGAGAAYFVLGTASGAVDLSTAAAKLVGETAGDAAGTSVALFDVDGDTLADALIGAPGQDGGGTGAGAAYLVLGSGLSGTIDLSAADVRVLGDVGADAAGSTVSGGDLDGDGYGDPAIGAPYSDAGGADAGVVYVLSATSL
jgi:hypothetical protein